MFFFAEVFRVGNIEKQEITECAKIVCAKETEKDQEEGTENAPPELSCIRTEYSLVQMVSHPRILEENRLVRTKIYDLSDAEYNLLLRLVEAEADGKELVANVVFNRVESVKFPNTVTEVILQQDGSGAQFSPVSDGRIDRVDVSAETMQAVEEVIYGEDLSCGALYFVARKTADPCRLRWFDNTLTPVLSHGGHEFFK